MKPSALAPVYFVLHRLPLLLTLGVLVAVLAPGMPPPQPTHPGINWEMIGNVGRTALLVAGVMAFLQLLYAIARVHSCTIALTDQGVELGLGVLAKRSELFLYSSIKDVIVTRSTLERVLGLASVLFCHSVGRDELIRGLRAADAQFLRDGALARLAGTGAQS